MTIVLPQSPNAYYSALDELLTYSAKVLDTIPTFPDCADLVGAPDARFISPGLPAIDCCPAMYAWGPQVQEGTTSPYRAILDPGHRSGSFNRINLPTLNIMVVRCTPSFANAKGDPPSSIELAASAKQVYADGWALWVELSRAQKQNLLFPRCNEFFMDSWSALDTSGGCAGATITIRVNVGGFTSVLPAGS